jgi:cyclophilin family peptidyl-prolyl cis-trans isomerase
MVHCRQFCVALALTVVPTSALGQERTITIFIHTEKGGIDVQLDAEQAPGTVANFLRNVDAGLYDGGQFHRTVKPDNQPDNKVKIEVIQAGVRPDKVKSEFPPIKLERTRDTRLRHKDGTISMARDGPDTATADFFICIGAQPELDFGGKRNPDGQGFAAFGRVVKGMDVVKTIQAAPADGQSLKPPVKIVSVKRLPVYTWERVTAQAPFAPRDGAGALTLQGRMWLLGGWNPGDKKHFPRTCNNEVWSSADGKDWRLDKANSFLDKTFDPATDWEGRHTAGYVVHQNKMWIVGGDVNQGHYHFDVWNSADGKTWTHVNPAQPVPWGPRALHYTLAFQDKIWVIGGQTIPTFAKANEVFYRDVWNSRDGVNWTEVKPKEPFWPQRGMIGGSAVFKGRIWILGGGTYDTVKVPTRKFFNDVWSSADGIEWQRHLDSAPWAPRQYHEVAVFDDRLWVLEGYHKANRNDVWHSADGINWHEVPNTPWRPRHAASVFVHDGALWMVAGNNMESDIWKLTRKK